MEPKLMDEQNRGAEQLMESGIGDEIAAMLNGKQPDARPPAAPIPPAPPAPPAPKKEDLPPPPKKDPPKPDFDPLSPEGMAAAIPRKDDGVMPADLLKDSEVERFGDKKQREAFIKERASHKEARVKLQEMAAKIQELQSQVADVGQVGELRAKLEAKEAEAKKYADDLAKMDLSRSPEFRKRYDDKLNQIGQRMVQTLTAEGVGKDEAAKLVRGLVAEKKASAREYALDQAVPSLKGTILSFLTQFDDASQERALALEKARETAAAIDDAESRGRLAALAGKVDSVAEKAAADAAALGSPYYREVKDNPEWNAAVAARKQTLKGLLLSQDPEKLAPYIAEGLTASDLRARYAAQYRELQALKKEYQDVVGEAPRLGRVPPGQPSVAPAKKTITLGAGSVTDDVESFLNRT